MTVYDVLHDEATWEDPAVVDSFQAMAKSGVHKAFCRMGLHDVIVSVRTTE